MSEVQFFETEGRLRALNCRAEMTRIQSLLTEATVRINDIEIALRAFDGTDADLIRKALLLAERRAAASFHQTAVAVAAIREDAA